MPAKQAADAPAVGPEKSPGEGAPGVETTTSDDSVSTFEPEEDPEAHDG